MSLLSEVFLHWFSLFIGFKTNRKSCCIRFQRCINVRYGRKMTFGRQRFSRLLSNRWLCLLFKKVRPRVRLFYVKRIYYSVSWHLFATIWWCWASHPRMWGWQWADIADCMIWPNSKIRICRRWSTIHWGSTRNWLMH